MNTNDAPSILTSTIPDAAEGILYSSLFTCQDQDPTVDTLTWSISVAGCPWLSIDNDNGTIWGIPAYGSHGIYTVSVSLSDGHVSVSRSYSLSIIANPQAPAAPFIHPFIAIDDDGDYDVLWSRPDFAAWYLLYEDDVLIQNTTETAFHISTKDNGTYTYTVRAGNSNGTSPLSGAVSIEIAIPDIIIARDPIDYIHLTGIGATYMVVVETSIGPIVFEMYDDYTPETIENFLTYVDEGFYDGLIFHRVVDDFVIQTGRFESGMSSRAGAHSPIDLEISEDMSHGDGAVAMARSSDPDSATSQFYICDGPQHDLDSLYAVFGHVIYGMEVVRAISAVPTHSISIYGDVPIDDIVIRYVTYYDVEATRPRVPYAPGIITEPYTTYSGTVSFEWAAVDGADEYQVFSNGMPIKTTTSTFYYDGHVAPGTYLFTVQASNQNGSSLLSAPMGIIIGDTGVPVAPEFITSSLVTSSTSYTIQWHPTERTSGYLFYENGDLIANMTATSYYLEDRSIGTYTYSVAAWNTEGVSNPSAEISVMTGQIGNELLIDYEIYKIKGSKDTDVTGSSSISFLAGGHVSVNLLYNNLGQGQGTLTTTYIIYESDDTFSTTGSNVLDVEGTKFVGSQGNVLKALTGVSGLPAGHYILKVTTLSEAGDEMDYTDIGIEITQKSTIPGFEMPFVILCIVFVFELKRRRYQ